MQTAGQKQNQMNQIRQFVVLGQIVPVVEQLVCLNPSI
jgi:hypothetical protein